MSVLKSSINTSASSNPEIIEAEHVFAEPTSLYLQLFGLSTAASIIALNIPLIIYTIKQHSMTFFNKLIITDCCLCIVNVAGVLRFSTAYIQNPYLCLFLPFYGYFINVLNRLLSIAIVFYRYVFVLNSSWVQTPRQRQLFCGSLSVSIVAISLTLTVFSFFYREYYLNYLGKTNRIRQGLCLLAF